MGMHIVAKKIITVFAFLAISSAVTSVETACERKPAVTPIMPGNIPAINLASAKPVEENYDKWFEGTWTGTPNNQKQTLTLKIESDKSGKDIATLQYDLPRDCTIKATESGIDKNKRQIFVFKIVDSVSCGKLSLGYLYLEQANNNGLSYEATSSDGKFVEKGNLTKGKR
jgi:hypothetical protein